MKMNIFSALVSASPKATGRTDTYWASSKSLQSPSWKFNNFLVCIIPTSADCVVLKFSFSGRKLTWREMKVNVGSCYITKSYSPCLGSQRNTRVGRNWHNEKRLSDDLNHAVSLLQPPDLCHSRGLLCLVKSWHLFVVKESFEKVESSTNTPVLSLHTQKWNVNKWTIAWIE